MRVLILLLALCAVADASPTQEGRTILFVVDRGLSPATIESIRLGVKGATYFEGDEFGVVAFDAKKAMVVRHLAGGKSRAVHSTDQETNVVIGLEAAHAMLLKSKRARRAIVLTDRKSTADVEAALAKLRADKIVVAMIDVASTKVVASAIQKELNRPAPGEETFAYVYLIDRNLTPSQFGALQEAARMHFEKVGPNDFIAVIAVDASPTFYVRPQRATNRMRISHDISRLKVGDGHDLEGALRLAFEAMKDVSASDKHVIVFGTGRGERVLDVVSEMAAADIVVSAVGGKEADRERLRAIAKTGNGQLQMLSSPMKMR